MSRPARILVTNDDGVDAPGIEVLRRIAEKLSDDVWVVAPEGNQSGAGHRFSLGVELYVDKREDRVFAVNGSPADCVVTGLTHVLKDKKPDLVLSGVNRGQNNGDLIHCSGTVAGAREGALFGCLGIALSQSMDFSDEHLIEWDCAETFGVDVVSTLWNQADGHETFFNVNFPRCAPEDATGVRIVPHQRFAHSPFELYPSDNEDRHFVAILKTPEPLTPGSDIVEGLDNNAITITPLLLQQTDFAAIDRLQSAFSRRDAAD